MIRNWLKAVAMPPASPNPNCRRFAPTSGTWFSSSEGCGKTIRLASRSKRVIRNARAPLSHAVARCSHNGRLPA